MPRLENQGGLTIRDIARITGYSRSTVSLAINDSPKINAHTKRLILDTISRVGYIPNPAARALGVRSREVVATRKAQARTVTPETANRSTALEG